MHSQEEEAKKQLLGINKQDNDSPLGRVPDDIDDDIPKEVKEVIDLGYKNMPMEALPSKGMFYPEGTRIEYRPATLEEIKHYSSMDDNDRLDVQEKIATILNNTVEVSIPGVPDGSYKDLKEFDKMCVLFTIRDISMLKHKRENKMFSTSECIHCGTENKVEIDSSVFGYYQLPKNLMKYYDSVERGFVFEHELIGKVIVYIPSIGVLQKIQDLIKKKVDKQRRTGSGFIDKEFYTFLQLSVRDHRQLTQDFRQRFYAEYKNWSYDKHEFMLSVAKKINDSIKPTIDIVCSGCKKKYSPVIFFKGGYRSIMKMTKITEDIFGDEEENIEE